MKNVNFTNTIQINKKFVEEHMKDSSSHMESSSGTDQSSQEEESSTLIFVKDVSGKVIVNNRHGDQLLLDEEAWHGLLMLAYNFGWKGKVDGGKIPEWLYLCMCGRREEADLTSLGPSDKLIAVYPSSWGYPFPTHYVLIIDHVYEMTEALERWLQSETADNPLYPLVWLMDKETGLYAMPVKDIQATIHFCREDDPNTYLSLIDDPIPSEESGITHYDA